MANNRIVVQQGSSAGAILGTYDIFGTNTGAETVTVFDGTTANFQGDFGRGGDIIRLADVAGDFTVSLSGSNAVLTSLSDGITVRIPIGSVGTTIVFQDLNGNFTDSRTLVFNGTNVVLGGQTVSVVPTAVTGGDVGNNPQSFVLTSGLDIFAGGAGADTFFASNNTLQAGDQLNGGLGSDILRVFTDQSLASKAYAGFELRNIETLEVTNDSKGAVTFDLSSSKDLTTLVNQNSTEQVQFNQVTGLANLVVRNLTDAAESDTTVQFQDTVVAGKNDSISLRLESSDADLIRVGRVGDKNGGIETINLDVSGRAATVNQLDSDITTLGLTGDVGLTVTTALNDTIRTIAGETFSGGASLSVATATGGVTVDLGAGNDSITGSGFADDIDVRGGNNTVNSGTGNDTVAAGNGDNSIATSDGIDSVTVGDGANTIDLGAGNDSLLAGNGKNTVTGGTGNDSITVGNGANTIDAGADNDVVSAGNGGNTIDLGAGNDKATTGTGADAVTTGAGLDTVSTGDGDDLIVGGANFDASGTETFVGSGIFVGDEDVISGGAGRDTLSINAGSADANFRFVDGVEVLTLTTAGSTTLSTEAEEAGIAEINALNAGNDVVNASTFSRNLTVNLADGNDTVTTGSGSDTFNVGALNDADVLNAGAGYDVLKIDEDTTLANPGFTGFEELVLGTARGEVGDNGNSYNITVDADNAPNPNVDKSGVLKVDASALQADDDGIGPNVAETLTFNASAVNNYRVNVIGGAAADTVTSGQLADTISTGAGNDSITLIAGNNVVDAGADNDTVTLGTGNDNVTAGTGNDNIVAATANLTANDSINGGEGTDTMTVTGATVDAQYTNASSIEVLTVTNAVTTKIGAQAEEAGIRTVNLADGGSTLSAGDYSAAANLTVNGGSGNDTILTGAGNDSVLGNAGNDSITTGAGDDFVAGGLGNDVIATGTGNDMVQMGTGSDNLDLGAGDDKVLVGSSGNDLSTTDSINGGTGFDEVVLVNTRVLDGKGNQTDGDITAGINLTNVLSVEQYRIDKDGGSVDLTFTGGSVNTLNTINIDATKMSGVNGEVVTVTLDAGQTDQDFAFTIQGGSGRDVFVKLNTGVDNNILFNAGAGSDEVRISAGQDLGSTTVLNGGADLDTITILGGSVSDDGFTSVSSFERVAASGTGLLIQLGELALAAGVAQLDADAGAFNDNIILDAKFSGPLAVTLGQGNDSFNAGASTSVVSFTMDATALTAADTIVGGKSANDTMSLKADGGTANATGVSGVESYVVIENGDANIGLTLSNASFGNVASGVIKVDASALNDTLPVGSTLDDTDLPEGNLTLNAAGVTAGAFMVTGGTGDDVLSTGSGSDTIMAGAGNDTINAGDGNNVISVGSGNNLVNTGSGNDTITNESGNNTVNSGGGDDSITLSDGKNVVNSGTGNDNVRLGGGDNIVDLGAGNDTLLTDNGDNLVQGGAGRDTITTGTGNDYITGGADGDTIVLGGGEDSVRYVQATESFGLAGSRDTVVGFGDDDTIVLETNILGAGVTGVNFVGVAKDSQEAQLAINLTKGDGIADAVYDVSTGRLLIDVNDDGNLVAQDLAINVQNADGSFYSFEQASDVFSDSSFILVDTIAPQVLGLDLLPASDTGDSASDDLTNANPVLVRVSFETAAVDGTAAKVGDVVTVSNAVTGVTTLPVALTANDIANGYVDISVALSNPGNVSSGTANELTAVIADGTGNSSSTSLDVVLDQAAPVVAVNDFDGVDGFLNDAEDNSVVISGTASLDTVGKTVSVAVTDGGTTVNGTAVVQANGTWATTGLNLSGLNNGPITASATVTDYAGNLSNTGTAGSTHDKTLPSVTILSNADSPVHNIADGSITYTINFSESVSGFAQGDVNVTGGSITSFSGSGASYTVVVAPNANFEGNVVVSVGAGLAADAAGNPNTASNTVTNAVDTLAPTIAISTPIMADDIINAVEGTVTSIAGSATNANGQTVTVTLTVTDAGSPNFGQSFTATALVSGGNWATGIVADLNSKFGPALSQELGDEVTIDVTVTDASGNPASATTTVVFDNNAPDQVYTDKSLEQEPDSNGTANDGDDDTSDFITNIDPVDVTYSYDVALDADDVIQISVNGGPWTTLTALNSELDTVAKTIKLLDLNLPAAPSTTTVEVRTVDLAGNPGNASALTPIVLDQAAPDVTAVTFASVSEEADSTGTSNDGDSDANAVTNQATADVVFNYTGTLNGAVGERFQYSLDGSLWLDVNKANVDEIAQTITLPGFDVTASPSIQIRAIDIAGNETSTLATQTITYDAKAPTVTATWASVSEDSDDPVANNVTNQATADIVFTYTGTLGGDENFQYSLDGGTTWIDVADVNVDSVAGEVTVTGIDVTGSPTIQLRAIDDAGNETAVLSTQAIVYDNVAPAITAVEYDNLTDTLVLTGTGFTTNGDVTIDTTKIGWDIDNDGDIDYVFPNLDSKSVTINSDTQITIQLSKADAAALETLTGFAGVAEDQVVVAESALIDTAGNQNVNTELFINLDLDGTDDPNVIFGGQLADELVGGLGNDTLTGRDGNDSIDGGEGNDVIWAGNGDDTVVAGNGNDLVIVSGTFAGPIASYNATLSSLVGFTDQLGAGAAADYTAGKGSISFGAGFDTLEVFGTVVYGDLGITGGAPEQVNLNSSLTLTNAELTALQAINLKGDQTHTIVISDAANDADAVAKFQTWANGPGQQVLFDLGIAATSLTIKSLAGPGLVYDAPAEFTVLLGGKVGELATGAPFDVSSSTNALINADGDPTFDVVFTGTPPSGAAPTADFNNIVNFDAGVGGDVFDFSTLAELVSPDSGSEDGDHNAFTGFIGAWDFELPFPGIGTRDTGTFDLNGKLAIVRSGSADSASQVQDMFQDTGIGDDQLFSMSTGGNGWMITGANDSNQAYLWYIEDLNDNGAITTDEVRLVARITMEFGDTIDSFHVDNFVFG
jgi:Ca2+-binding RTX toxin-like protein